MHLGDSQKEKIVRGAKNYLGYPYGKGFDCIGFVRQVYQEAGIAIYKLTTNPPPKEFNISVNQLKEPPVGHMIFLKDRFDPRKNRAWTHVVIALGGQRCIHCSLHFGGKVLESSLAEIMRERYDFAPSIL